MPKIGSVQLADPPLDLGEPGTIEFTAERALAGQAHNRFALSLRSPGDDRLNYFGLDNYPDRLDDLVAVPVREYMRLGGTEAAELTLWFAMRAALPENATAVYTFQTFPAITGCGALVMAEPGELPETEAGAGTEDPGLTANLEGGLFTAMTSSREEQLRMSRSVP